MKKLRNTEAELNKSLAYKKSVLNMIFVNDICWHRVVGEAMKRWIVYENVKTRMKKIVMLGNYRWRDRYFDGISKVLK